MFIHIISKRPEVFSLSVVDIFHDECTSFD